MRYYLPIADNGGGSVKANYMASLIKAVSESGIDIRLGRASDSLASRAMNKVTNDFLATDCDAMVIIDCDIICTPEHLRRLCSHDVELVYGMYPKRQPMTEMCFSVINNGDTPPADGSLWSVRRAGRGFVKIARSLLERMKEDNGGEAIRFHNHGRIEWDFWPTEVISGEYCTTGQGADADGYPFREYLSEDFAFCDRARRMGVPVLMDTQIMLRHEGDCIFPIRYTPEMLPDILRCFSDKELGPALKENGFFDREGMC